MKKWLSLMLAVLCCLHLCCPAVHAADPLGISAQAYVLMEADTGKVLLSKNGDEKRPIASTTKIMTTLLCLESGGLDDWFVVDPEAIRVEGSSMGLQEGDVVTKRMLCYGMLLPSGNDAANATAVRLAGSIPEFAKLMNARAARIGMTHTCFVTPSGLDAEGHGASVRDMGLLARTAMQNPDFRAICSQSRAEVCFGNPPYNRWLKNTNKLLTMYEGVVGVKTGFTDAAGRCLVSFCERDGVSLLCVTLHAKDDWNDHMKLYDYGFAHVVSQPVEPPDALSVSVVGGTADTVALRTRDPLSVGTDNGDLRQLMVQVQVEPFLYAPVPENARVGNLAYYYEGRHVADVPLYTVDAVAAQEQEPETPGFWQALLARIRSWF
ncbi:D-alanyl-D-alanine carboxypeptidase family protein [Ruminococcus champanellensis]|uniref:serine-type D-Ala-D-Ala carboxypeptidase n=1 Tax=Ruminococcus champanellensis (strain DSM 18848 / JCM 17042 / KCTC 15320 / 18P13) TaxID=213810 RepID=D4LCY5_RUMC1|nr:D-alanyl-D-alanine carboxypeptidase family protein [Ruminococcus champanellensis]CBL17480.1 D-alanyl-D-alanine carboxypeptidase [Ruminococcus champanellensis 18P13 = JCM 17042]